jgi:hypothetical protein
MYEVIHGIKFVTYALFCYQAVCIQTVRRFVKVPLNNPTEPSESLECNHIIVFLPKFTKKKTRDLVI